MSDFKNHTVLVNTHTQFRQPKRIVIIGATGFIGRNLIRLLQQKQYTYLALGSSDIDLTAPKATQQIQEHIKAGDAIVFLSALAPRIGRGLDTYMKNITMLSTFLIGIRDIDISHFIYMSSDAVYSFATPIISETTQTSIGDYYSLMHYTRECIVQRERPHHTLILRPTMVYGFDDTHNAYGPNRFIRQAVEKGQITLGGKGEDTRDYIFISDLCEIILLSLGFTTLGTLNIASGRSISGMMLARTIQKYIPHTEILQAERTQDITHRSFDVSNIRSVFPEFSFTDITEVIRDDAHRWQ